MFSKSRFHKFRAPFICVDNGQLNQWKFEEGNTWTTCSKSIVWYITQLANGTRPNNSHKFVQQMELYNRWRNNVQMKSSLMYKIRMFDFWHNINRLKTTIFTLDTHIKPNLSRIFPLSYVELDHVLFKFKFLVIQKLINYFKF